MANSEQIVGDFRQFGAYGPVYQVMGMLGEHAVKGKMLRVKVLETGEEVEYPYSDAMNDPEAK